MYEELHHKFTSTYFRRTLKRNKNSILCFVGATAVAHCTHKREQINVCCANKSFLNFSTRKLPLHWLLFNVFFFLLFTSTFFLLSTCSTLSKKNPPIESRHSKAEVKKCTLTISIYAKHIIALYMITIFRNLSSKFYH